MEHSHEEMENLGLADTEVSRYRQEYAEPQADNPVAPKSFSAPGGCGYFTPPN
jgi:hypothetical protein